MFFILFQVSSFFLQTRLSCVQGCKPDAVFFLSFGLVVKCRSDLLYTFVLDKYEASVRFFFKKLFFCNSELNLFNWRTIIWVSFELKLKFWFLFFFDSRKTSFHSEAKHRSETKCCWCKEEKKCFCSGSKKKVSQISTDLR